MGFGKDKHKYSTIALIFIGALLLLASVVSISTDDVDILCDTNNALLKRVSGSWGCSVTSFGEMVITSDTTISLPNHNTYYTITNMTIEHGNNIASDNNSYFNILKAGNYRINAHTSFSGGGNTEYEMEIFINNVAHNHCELHRKMGTGGDVGSASLGCFETLSVGDNITIKVADNTNPSQNINIHHISFMIEEVQ